MKNIILSLIFLISFSTNALSQAFDTDCSVTSRQSYVSTTNSEASSSAYAANLLYRFYLQDEAIVAIGPDFSSLDEEDGRVNTGYFFDKESISKKDNGAYYSNNEFSEFSLFGNFEMTFSIIIMSNFSAVLLNKVRNGAEISLNDKIFCSLATNENEQFRNAIQSWTENLE